MTADDLPLPPPEGKLIRAARERAIPKLSIRAAAARISISPEHWGNIERGYKSVAAGKEPVRVTADAPLLAKMAATVGVTPPGLETEGQRPDAAQALREQRERPAQEPVPARHAETSPSSISAVAEAMDAEAFAALIRQRLAILRDRGVEEPDGRTLFDGDGGDPFRVGGAIVAGMTDAWDEAMRARANPAMRALLDMDTAAELAGKTWVRLAAHVADRQAGRGTGST